VGLRKINPEGICTPGASFLPGKKIPAVSGKLFTTDGRLFHPCGRLSPLNLCV
jgi:hypothetical protein